jgi:Ca2+-binding RTX toxin-like protein
LQNQYISTGNDSLNVTATTPDWFIHTGSGTDAISTSSGTNVLDGGTGSNFLVGGTGADTFFVDDRAASADIWSTVVGFHQADAATIWGATPQDFNLAWVDGQGAAGYTGLTLHATAPSSPTASLTLTGYTHADLTNGRLTVQFGTDAASGSAYMYIHGNA